ncbi:KTSC domain-containing protein [Rhodoplanes sp. TEM]|uniref:KTSC domain-containing protein n=1 Tax=Rhodoplanes tepidamans TaxID=200616 RepID=A0ABT5JDU9_RHOTP|nr:MULTISPECIES: KTSC domain-containing protein [Rhodoplanes]MDC7787250.1 KTSC domain-containing protein [Rhodoplanes tepidamans]MDC7985278.1 KTSC domain-containing protein [Rhodoplanes sp. TEM]MDQ0357785.1 hypothetical protein [Rhodoplanes tepidamans]
MPDVDSSAIRSARYDAAEHVLEITFVTGRVYVYGGVPETIYDAFLKAESKGRFFNERIRDAFATARKR